MSKHKLMVDVTAPIQQNQQPPPTRLGLLARKFMKALWRRVARLIPWIKSFSGFAATFGPGEADVMAVDKSTVEEVFDLSSSAPDQYDDAQAKPEKQGNASPLNPVCPPVDSQSRQTAPLNASDAASATEEDLTQAVTGPVHHNADASDDRRFDKDTSKSMAKADEQVRLDSISAQIARDDASKPEAQASDTEIRSRHAEPAGFIGDHDAVNRHTVDEPAFSHNDMEEPRENARDNESKQPEIEDSCPPRKTSGETHFDVEQTRIFNTNLRTNRDQEAVPESTISHDEGSSFVSQTGRAGAAPLIGEEAGSKAGNRGVRLNSMSEQLAAGIGKRLDALEQQLRAQTARNESAIRRLQEQLLNRRGQ